MNIFFYVIILVIIVLIIDRFRDKPEGEETEEERLPFKKKEFLLNVPERKFFEVLLQKIPTNYVVYPQVILSSVIQFNGYRQSFWKWHNQINRKTLDFVIFEKEYLKPIMAIEYDGSTHNREDRKERDEFVNNALTQVGIKVVHIKHFQSMDLDSIITTEILSNLQ
jgi:very-short-patch-repair endonuclease